MHSDSKARAAGSDMRCLAHMRPWTLGLVAL